MDFQNYQKLNMNFIKSNNPKNLKKFHVKYILVTKWRIFFFYYLIFTPFNLSYHDIFNKKVRFCCSMKMFFITFQNKTIKNFKSNMYTNACWLTINYCSPIFILGYVCLAISIYPNNVKMAEPIGPKLNAGPTWSFDKENVCFKI